MHDSKERGRARALLVLGNKGNKQGNLCLRQVQVKNQGILPLISISYDRGLGVWDYTEVGWCLPTSLAHGLPCNMRSLEMTSRKYE